VKKLCHCYSTTAMHYPVLIIILIKHWVQISNCSDVVTRIVHYALSVIPLPAQNDPACLSSVRLDCRDGKTAIP